MIVLRKQPFITKICGRFFYPGNNIITDKDLAEKLQTDSTFQNLEKLGFMEVVNESASLPAATPTDTDESTKQALLIKNIKKVAEAVKVVQGVLDIRVLRKIIEVDSRGAVSAAAQAQIAVMTSDRVDENKE